MSMTDPAAAPSDEPTPQGSAAPGETPVIEETEREVTLQRSVRVGRVVVGAAILGAVVAALLSLLFPVKEGADYTLGQVAGFSAVIGAAIGLGVGGLLVMVLGALVKRKHGTGVAIQSDVR